MVFGIIIIEPDCFFNNKCVFLPGLPESAGLVILFVPAGVFSADPSFL
jgi:hypothetical protein